MQINEWIKYQEENSKNIICVDDFDVDNIKYVGGVDISFNKTNPLLACGYITIIDFLTNDIVYEDHQNVTMIEPYISGFLGFREINFLNFQRI